MQEYEGLTLWLAESIKAVFWLAGVALGLWLTDIVGLPPGTIVRWILEQVF